MSDTATRSRLERASLVEATIQGSAGRQASRIALGMIALITLIPALVAVMRPDDDGVVFVALGVGLTASLWAAISLRLSLDAAPRWLPALNNLLYASLISGLLLLFVQRGNAQALSYIPLLFMLYILLIGASSLRQEDRLPLLSGTISAAQFVAVTAWARWVADDFAPERAEFILREFDWVRTAARLFILSAATVLAKEMAWRGHKLHEQTVKDTLTGLLNRTSFDEILDRQFERARRERFPISIAMLDLDSFKRLNDTRGHAVGDTVLRHVGEVLETGFGASETVGRYGGEEFVAALPDAPESHVRARLEELRRAVEQLNVRDPRSGQPLRVTVSIGVASWPDDGVELGQVFRTADERLYAAKAAGRNRVAWGDPAEAAPDGSA
jgi:two-component system cell cycle response regulator